MRGITLQIIILARAILHVNAKCVLQIFQNLLHVHVCVFVKHWRTHKYNAKIHVYCKNDVAKNLFRNEPKRKHVQTKNFNSICQSSA